MEAIAIVILLGVTAYFFFKYRTKQSTPLSVVGKNQSRPSDQDWVQPFILYYVASEMRLSGEGTLPDTLRALAAGRTNETQTQQSMLVALGWYLSFAYKRDRKPADWPLAAVAGRDFLQVELRTLNSTVALSRFVRRNTEGDVSESALKAEVVALGTKIRNDDELGMRIRNMMLKDNVEELFRIRHGESIRTYADKLLAHQEALMM